MNLPLEPKSFNQVIDAAASVSDLDPRSAGLALIIALSDRASGSDQKSEYFVGQEARERKARSDAIAGRPKLAVVAVNPLRQISKFRFIANIVLEAAAPIFHGTKFPVSVTVGGSASADGRSFPHTSQREMDRYAESLDVIVPITCSMLSECREGIVSGQYTPRKAPPALTMRKLLWSVARLSLTRASAFLSGKAHQ